MGGMFSLKITFLGAHSSIHIVKWVNEMAERGHNVNLITMHPGEEKLNKNVVIYKLPIKPPLGYYLNTLYLKILLKKIKPDILNTHYASGYGTLARLSDFQPNLLSVWGSDVFDFPYESRFKMKILQKNLKTAFRIASTSYVMKKQTERIFKPLKEIAITPFGVDCEKFKPLDLNKVNNKIVIGTVKRMAPKYGISNLIKAFALVKSRTDKNIELILVGGGKQEEELKNLAKKLSVDKYISFVGAVPHSDVPKWLNRFDIYCALSESESFGVAIIEASACGVPVVVSDAGGLLEVVVDNKTGYIVPRNNPEITAEKIEILVNNEKLRKKMGEAGRSFVLENYEWKENADMMEKIYNEVIKDFKKAN